MEAMASPLPGPPRLVAGLAHRRSTTRIFARRFGWANSSLALVEAHVDARAF